MARLHIIHNQAYSACQLQTSFYKQLDNVTSIISAYGHNHEWIDSIPFSKE